MHPLAEFSDKIPSVTFTWSLHLAAAAVVFLLALASQRRAALILLPPAAIAWAAPFVYLALTDHPFSAAILDEMGTSYILHRAPGDGRPDAPPRHLRPSCGRGFEMKPITGYRR